MEGGIRGVPAQQLRGGALRAQNYSVYMPLAQRDAWFV